MSNILYNYTRYLTEICNIRYIGYKLSNLILDISIVNIRYLI